ncbi:MAG TPA: ketopantoate reductase family protein [Candidatus Binatia bacterium]|nr:ketopantoate reductase family protein [Candidatus Binatia bacterium]
MVVWSVGAGAIGGTVAARLVRAGVDPLVLDTNAEHVARLRAPGLRVDGLDGGVVTPLRAAAPGDALRAEPCDVVLLSVRSQSTAAALRPLVPRLGAASDVVSLQNGLNEERIAALVGSARTIGCVVGFGATWIGPGHVELTSPGELVLGRLDGSHDDRLAAVEALLARAFPTRITDNITGALWAKMLINSVTVLGAVGGLLLGDVIAWNPRVLAHLLAEGVDVATAEQVQLEDVFGLVPAALVATRTPGWDDMLVRALEAVGRNFGRIKSVTWRDLELGRPTEIESVTGEIVRRARSRAIPAPLNTAAYAMLREIEAGQRPISRENLLLLERMS